VLTSNTPGLDPSGGGEKYLANGPSNGIGSTLLYTIALRYSFNISLIISVTLFR